MVIESTDKLNKQKGGKDSRNKEVTLAKATPAMPTPVKVELEAPEDNELVSALSSPEKAQPTPPSETPKPTGQTISPVSTQAPGNPNTQKTETTSPEVKDTQVSDGDLMASVRRAGEEVGERVFQTYAVAATTSLEHAFSTRIPEFNQRFASKIRAATAKQADDLRQRLTGSGSSPSIAIEASASAVDSLPAAKDTDGEG